MTGLKGSFTLRPPDAYLQVAADWPVRMVSRETEPDHHHVVVSHLERKGKPFRQAHLICMVCSQSVCCLSPDLDGTFGYPTSAGAIQSGVLAHLKVAHEDALPLT